MAEKVSLSWLRAVAGELEIPYRSEHGTEDFDRLWEMLNDAQKRGALPNSTSAYTPADLIGALSQKTAV